jgi:hypothetical protein
MTPQEKTALLNEVIEYMNEMYINGKTHPFVYINDIKQKLYTMMRPDENESLLPKEEPIDWSKASKDNIPVEEPEPTQEISTQPENLSTPVQEIKAGDEAIDTRFDELGDVLHIIGDEAWFQRKDRTTGAVVPLSKLRKVEPTKTQEEMDREWFNKFSDEYFKFKEPYIVNDTHWNFYKELINYGRNTKQN